jgi:hypothetical protein
VTSGQPAGYRDRWIECTPAELRIRGYYFPWGTKRIPYWQVRGLRRVSLSPLRGKARIWGTGNPRYWASLDPGRPGKSVGLVLDLGGRVHPFLTPADPLALEALLRQRCGLGPGGAHQPPAPLL